MCVCKCASVYFIYIYETVFVYFVMPHLKKKQIHEKNVAFSTKMERKKLSVCSESMSKRT